MLKRIKRAWKLSKHPDAIYVPTTPLTDNDPRALTEDIRQVHPSDIGDGKAAFFGEPTPEEELEYKREQEGTLPWYKRLRNL